MHSCSTLFSTPFSSSWLPTWATHQILRFSWYQSLYQLMSNGQQAQKTLVSFPGLSLFQTDLGMRLGKCLWLIVVMFVSVWGGEAYVGLVQDIPFRVSPWREMCMCFAVVCYPWAVSVWHRGNFWWAPLLVSAFRLSSSSHEQVAQTFLSRGWQNPASSAGGLPSLRASSYSPYALHPTNRGTEEGGGGGG